MKGFIAGLILAAGFSSAALAQDEQDLANFGYHKGETFQYGWATEKTENEHGHSLTEKWASVRSGHLTAGINSDLNKYRLRLNSSGGELLGVQNTAVGKNFLNKFQVEAGAATSKSPYGLLALELPVVKPATFFIGSVHNPGGAQRFVLGPILYYGHSTSLLFYYPKGVKSDSPVEHGFNLRNRIREWENVWLDADVSYKVVPEDEKVDDFSPVGYSVALGVWKVYGKYAVAPYYEGNKLQKTSYEFGVDASF